MNKRKRKHTSNATISFAKGFRAPTLEECVAALEAPKRGLPTIDQKHPLHNTNFFDVDTAMFSLLPSPLSPYDWLAQDVESPQSFSDYYQSICLRNGKFKPFANANKSTIYILPLGSFNNPETNECYVDLNLLVQYTKAFYTGCQVSFLPVANITQRFTKEDRTKEKPKFYWLQEDEKHEYEIKGRYDKNTKKRQLNVNPILDLLANIRKKREFQRTHNDCFCIMCVTLEDLYDDHPDLFVAGMANGGSKVAVFSFARYAPHVSETMSVEHWWDWNFQNSNKPQKSKKKKQSQKENQEEEGERTKEYRAEWLKRSVKLLVHELGHLYGIGHCIYFDCIMNGSGHLEEDFRQSLHLCPIDLKKLTFRLPNFDPLIWYQNLLKFYKEQNQTNVFQSEQTWIEKKIRGSYR